jgi:uncharacterized membrane protein
MKVKHFLSALEHARVHAAIQDSEQGTSGDIVVYITHKRVTDPLTAAQREFRKLGLETAANKDGFLLFVAPASQKFAVVGGTALHDKTGQAWWDHLSALLTRHFKESRYTDAQAPLPREKHRPRRPAGYRRGVNPLPVVRRPERI